MLIAQNLKKTYKTKGGVEVHALDDVSITFPEKGIVFLLGKSGSGKSTLLNVLGGLDHADSGEIIIKGRNSKDFSSADFDSYRNTFVGFIFQEYNILNEFTVEQNISLALQLQGKPNDKEAVNEYLARVDLTGMGKRKPNTLSGGQKQRVAIARALIKNPEIIMADEPTGALDSNTGKQVFETLRKLSEEKLIIVVSHDREFAEIYGDRIVELADGKIISDVSKEHVTAKKVSDNVNIINDHTFSIKDTSELTKEDFNSLYEVIKKSNGEAIFTSGSHDVPLVKQAVRIQSDNSTDVFNETKEIQTKEYNGKETKFIRSRLPFARAFKMGASSIKTKPVRMVFTAFLTSVALVMFGVASTLMFFDENDALSDVLMKSDRKDEALAKSCVRDIYESHYDSEGNYGYSGVWHDGVGLQFNDEDIAYLNNNNAGLRFTGLYTLSGTLFKDIDETKVDKKYSPYFERITSVDADFINHGSFTVLAGSFPQNKDEVMITEHQFNALKGCYNVESFNQMVDKTIKYSHYDVATSSDVEETLKISGVLRTGTYPEKFNDYLSGSSFTQELITAFRQMVSNSFYTTLITNKTFFNNYRNLINRSYVSLSETNTIVAQLEGVSMSVGDEWGEESIASNQTYERFKDLVTFTDLNGNPIQYVAPNSSQVYISKNAYMLSKRKIAETLINAVENYSDSIQSHFTHCATYTGEEVTSVTKAKERVSDFYYNYMVYEQLNDDLETLTSFYNKYIAGVLEIDYLNRFAGFFTEAYGCRSAIDGLDNTTNENFVAQYYAKASEDPIDYNYFHTTVKEFLNLESTRNILKKYVVCTRMYDYEGLEGINEKYFNGETISLTQDEIDTYYELLRTNDKGQYQECNYNYNYSFTIGNSTKLKVNYRIYETNTVGKLDVIGVFSPNNSSPATMINVSYIASDEFVNMHARRQIYREDFRKETIQYNITENDIYDFALAATNYTKAEIAVMRKNGLNGTVYSITNQDSALMSMILGTISTLKPIFLYIGLAFAVFSSLMLFNFISSSITSKTKEIGILRAVGARGSDLFKIFFSESSIVALICFAIGIGGSIPLIYYLNTQLANAVYGRLLVFGPLNIGIIAGVCLVITFIGTFIPVLIASKKAPVDSIRTI